MELDFTIPIDPTDPLHRLIMAGFSGFMFLFLLGMVWRWLRAMRRGEEDFGRWGDESGGMKASSFSGFAWACFCFVVSADSGLVALLQVKEPFWRLPFYLGCCAMILIGQIRDYSTAKKNKGRA